MSVLLHVCWILTLCNIFSPNSLKPCMHFFSEHYKMYWLIGSYINRYTTAVINEHCICLNIMKILKMAVFWVVELCSLVEVNQRFIGACCLHLQGKEAASTSETSVNFCQTTRRNNPEDSHLHTRHRGNLKSQLWKSCCLHPTSLGFLVSIYYWYDKMQA
jgi:hypothetical protein